MEVEKLREFEGREIEKLEREVGEIEKEIERGSFRSLSRVRESKVNVRLQAGRADLPRLRTRC